MNVLYGDIDGKRYYQFGEHGHKFNVIKGSMMDQFIDNQEQARKASGLKMILPKKSKCERLTETVFDWIHYIIAQGGSLFFRTNIKKV